MANQDDSHIFIFDLFDFLLLGTLLCLCFILWLQYNRRTIYHLFSKFTYNFLVLSLNNCLWLQELCDACEASELMHNCLIWVEEFGQGKIEDFEPIPFYFCPTCPQPRGKRRSAGYVQYMLLPCQHGVCQACARKSPDSDDVTNICPRCKKEVILATRLFIS